MDCRNIRKLIDEADKAVSIPLEVSRHIDRCPECNGFADERFRLRQLLAASARVTAPANFDVVLRARLAQRRSSNWLEWLTPSLSLKVAAGVAMIAIAAFSVQLYRTNSNKGVIETAVNLTPTVEIPTASGSSSKEAATGLNDTAAAIAPEVKSASGKSISRRATRSAQERRDIEQLEAAAVLLMRDHTSDRQFTVSAISLGAQPIMSLDGNNQMARVVRTSF